MARAKKPTIPWDPAAWMGDEVHTCSFAARGLWVELLNLMRLSPKPGYLLDKDGKAMTPEAIAEATNADDTFEVNSLIDELKKAEVPGFTDDGVMFNRRMVREEEKRRKCSEAGRRGGNPNLTGKRADPQPRRGQGTKNVLFDNTVPVPEKKAAKKPTKKKPSSADEVPVPEALDTQNFRKAWEDWKKYRRQARKPLTPISVERQFAMLSRLGADAAVASIEQSIERGWQGLFEPQNGTASKSTDPIDEVLMEGKDL